MQEENKQPRKPEAARPVFSTPESSSEEERTLERALRPEHLCNYVGQERLVAQVDLLIKASIARGEPVDHVLLSGPAGLGKTTLARIIAAERGVTLRTVMAPAIERPGDLAGILCGLAPCDMLFIDEIHRLPAQVEEVLYSAMEDFRLDITVTREGEGAGTAAITVPLSPFTLVGATTLAGSLSAPLRDRFGLIGRFAYYDEGALARIALASAAKLGLALDPEAGALLARCSRGTPRITNRLLRRVKDFAQVRNDGQTLITAPIVREVLTLFDVQADGLDAADVRLLRALEDRFDGRPTGLSTLSGALGEAEQTIAEVTEPYLLQRGLIERTPRGRLITQPGRAALARA